MARAHNPTGKFAHLPLCRVLNSLMERQSRQWKEVAFAAGVSEAALGKWLNGEALPTDERVARLASYFHVDPAYLRYGSTRLHVNLLIEVMEAAVPMLEAGSYDMTDSRVCRFIAGLYEQCDATGELPETAAPRLFRMQLGRAA